MEEVAQDIPVLLKVLPICAGTIAATGSITNSLSLSFFINRAQRTLTNTIFMMLNAFDLLVSILNVAVTSFFYCKSSICGYEQPLFRVFVALVDVSVEGTAFATCLLTVTRTIALCLPFYSIRKKIVGIATVLFFVQVVSRALLRFYFYYIEQSKMAFYFNLEVAVLLVSLTTVIIVNIFSTALSVGMLLRVRNKFRNVKCNRDHGRRTRQKATLTILIVTLLFCFLNANFCITLYLVDFEDVDLSNIVAIVVFRFSFWLSLPLNSAINPVIYFTRKKKMREYLKEVLSKVFQTSR